MGTEPIRPSTWRYIASPDVAEEYDEYFADSPLFTYDTALLDEWFRPPGRVLDLGCGTGRHVLALARRGFAVTGLDLSASMVRAARAKLARANLAAEIVERNFLDLPRYIAPRSFDYAIIMFSTFGLIAGVRNRYRLLRHVHGALKPGGLLAVHVHGRWHNLWYPDGWEFLLGNVVRTLLGADEWGDKYLSHYRGIENMFIHVFSRREIGGLLERAGFAVQRLVCLNRRRSGELHRWLRSHWLPAECCASGFIVLAQARPERARRARSKTESRWMAPSRSCNMAGRTRP